MSVVRRRLIRPSQNSAVRSSNSRLHERRLLQIAIDRQALKRWLSKLKRAFNTFERLHARILRLEKLINQS